jgi:hypothetical protein
MHYHLLPFIEQGNMHNDSATLTGLPAPLAAGLTGFSFALWPFAGTDTPAQGGLGIPINVFGLPDGALSGNPSVVPVYARAVKTYLCPSDPTVTKDGTYAPQFGAGVTTNSPGNVFGQSSYAGNVQVYCRCTRVTGPSLEMSTLFGLPAGTIWPVGQFDLGLGGDVASQGEPTIPGTFQDGMSNTILYAEKFAHCFSPNAQAAITAGGGAAQGWAFDGGNLWAYDWLDQAGGRPAVFAPLHPGFANSSYAQLVGFAGFTEATPFLGLPSPNPTFPTNTYQYIPVDGINCNPVMASTAHAGGIVVCMADGSCRTIGPSIDPITWWALCTPQSGEPILPGTF